MFNDDPYLSKSYKHLEDLENIYTDLCNISGNLPFIDNEFLPSGDVDIYKSILKITTEIQEQIKFIKSESKL